jgi:hypothetical protein
MDEYSFYEYNEEEDKINIYSENIYEYFNSNYDLIIGTIDFDHNQNLVLFVENIIDESTSIYLERKLLEKIKHLNDVEIKKTKIILIFDVNKIEIF